MAEVDGLRMCSSILPWRGCAPYWPWAGTDTASRTSSAVQSIATAAPTVWGGDWNDALTGSDWTGSFEGRSAILDTVEALGLTVATLGAKHVKPEIGTIDHIAVPTSWGVTRCEHHPADAGNGRLSDHDAYVVIASP